jgi:hypothetical protein
VGIPKQTRCCVDGHVYFNKDETRQTQARGSSFYPRAVAGGVKRAVGDRDKAASKMTRAQIAEAQKLARKLLEKLPP